MKRNFNKPRKNNILHVLPVAIKNLDEKNINYTE